MIRSVEFKKKELNDPMVLEVIFTYKLIDNEINFIKK